MKKIAIFLMLIIVLVAAMPVSTQGVDLQVPDAALKAVLSGKTETSIYIVHMIEDPAIAYEGGVAGILATRPLPGLKLDRSSANVQQYVNYLRGRHDVVLETVGASDRKIYDYHYSVNGFAARLTAAEAAALRAQPGVLTVTPDEIHYLQTDSSPEFLGLTAPGGPWDLGFDGEDVIVGVIDTGIWPEHPSFDPAGYGQPPRGFRGTGCDFGNTAFNPDDASFQCNNKLLAAKSYSAGFLANEGGPEGLAPGSYLSARDEDGHGTHTTSTAAGNSGVNASVLGNDWGVISGMAPRARVSTYKACWSITPEEGGCYDSDTVAAIDDAVADGVDVINYSIGGGASLLNPVDIAFLFAADAGVFVANSAGNDGPGPGTVTSPGTVPWITTVGASTQSRDFIGSVILGNGEEYTGVTLTGGTSELPLVDAADAGDELCTPGALDPDVVAGKIVLCLRGVIARVAKSQAVEIAGGAGMILYNAVDPDTLNTDNHYVPSLHVSNADGVAIKAYIAAEGADATAMLTGGSTVFGQGSVMAAFSSRGPDVVATDIIKPDVTAPGVNILAGNTPTALLGAPGQLFQAISGTSMSSPHVAGVAALIKDARPGWSPARIRSALMTTARQDVTKEDGVTPADPFDMGAGHIAPGGPWDRGSVVQPGLVYDAGLLEYLGFLCDAAPEAFADPEGTCSSLESSGIPTDASDLNLPSIGIGELVGTQTISRTVTSVARGGAVTYRVSVDAPPGVEVEVSPSVLTLRRGRSATYTVTFTVTDEAVTDEWAFGSLTWTDRAGEYVVRSPIAVRPVPLDAPAEVSGSGTEGSLSFDVQFGYTGPYTAAPHGLVPADTVDGNVQDDPANDINVALDCFLSTGDPACGLTLHLVTVPADSIYARFSLFDDFTDGNDDLDLYVFHPDGSFAGGSGTPTSAEQVDVAFPAAGDYFVFVHGWGTDGPDANYTLFDWVFGPDEGNMSVSAPSSATLGESGTVTVEWAGLAPDTRYLGAVSHNNNGDILGLTLVNISTE